MIYIRGDMQELFDTAVRHIIEQGEKSLSALDSCSYKTSSGLKCVIGTFIPENQYNTRIEGYSIDELIRKKEIRFDDVKVKREFLIDMQMAHDMTISDEYFLKSFITDMEKVASKYDLGKDVLKLENENA